MAKDQLYTALRSIITFDNIQKVVPVISNSFRLDQIFGPEKRVTDITAKIPEMVLDDGLTIKEQLTRIWAEKIKYPMADDYQLWRVAQFYQVILEGSDKSKVDYLRFLKGLLLEVNANKEGKEEIVAGFQHDRVTHFSAIANELGYFSDPEQPDPFFTLADMPFPVYLTTSPYDFLERAISLKSEGMRKPRTQVIFWEPDAAYDEDTLRQYSDPDFVPSDQEPAVYHLFGLQDFPGSLVISEEDYLKFLISIVTSDMNATPSAKKIILPRLRQALSSSHLLLMGYHLLDWEFRVLFRLISNFRQGDKQGIFIQQGPEKKDEALEDYLSRFFNMKKFKIGWKSSEEFVQDLWRLWKEDLA